jgi:hypothetical protein
MSSSGHQRRFERKPGTSASSSQQRTMSMEAVCCKTFSGFGAQRFPDSLRRLPPTCIPKKQKQAS